MQANSVLDRLSHFGLVNVFTDLLLRLMKRALTKHPSKTIFSWQPNTFIGDNLNIIPIIYLYGLVILMMVVGLPFSQWLKEGQKFSSMATILFSVPAGFGIYLGLVFTFTRWLGVGTDSIAWPILVGLLLFSAGTLYFRGNELFKNSEYKWILLFLIMSPVAAASIMAPILADKWEMAYGAGDDGSRILMFADYFRHHPHVYFETTKDTLRWDMLDRPLYAISGAAIASLFHTDSPLTYSLLAAMALICASFALQLFALRFFEGASEKKVFLSYCAIILSLGFYGGFIDLFYQGRTTQLFSIYPVTFGLLFVHLLESPLRFGLWVSFCATLVGHFYSIRFTFLYLVMVGSTVLLKHVCHKGQVAIRRIPSFAAGLAIAGLLSVCLQIEEFSYVLSKQNEMLVQKGARFGLYGSNIDTLFNWIGLIGTFQKASELPLWVLISSGILVSVILVLTVRALFSKIRHSVELVAIVAFFSIAFAMSIFGGQYFLGRKILTYIPPLLLVVLLVYFVHWNVSSKLQTLFKYVLVALCGLFVFVTFTVQSSHYNGLVQGRSLGVKSDLTGLVPKLDSLTGCSGDCSSVRIFGYDPGRERHLLLRQILGRYAWQPMRGRWDGGEPFWFEYDLYYSPGDKRELDKYKFSYLVKGDYDFCDVIDWKKNGQPLGFYQPYTLYDTNVNFAEYYGRFRMETGVYDSQNRCQQVAWHLKPSGVLRFINGRESKLLTLTVRGSLAEKTNDQGVKKAVLESLPVEINVKDFNLLPLDKALNANDFVAKIDLELIPNKHINNLKLRMPKVLTTFSIIKISWD